MLTNSFLSILLFSPFTEIFILVVFFSFKFFILFFKKVFSVSVLRLSMFSFVSDVFIIVHCSIV